MSQTTTVPVSPSEKSSQGLHRLFRHMSTTHGTFSKETFLSLFSAVGRLVSEQPYPAVVVASTGNDRDFNHLLAPLLHREHVVSAVIGNEWGQNILDELPPRSGFFVVLTEQVAVTLYWSADARRSLQMYHGGWTFHPQDTKLALTELLASDWGDAESDSKTAAQVNCQKALDGIQISSQPSPMLEGLVSSLVSGLEDQSRELGTALGELKALHQKLVDQERLAAIGQLCSVVAHEIRNPLGLIDLYAKLIENQYLQWADAIPDNVKSELPGDPDMLPNNLTLIRDSIQSLESILSELTQYSRPLTLDCAETDVVGFVRKVCAFYQPKYDEKSVQLTVDVAQHLESSLFSSMDAPRVQQALINLLKNALEASPSDTKVTVRVASRKDDRFIYIKVDDQGKGVPDTAQQKLFTPYFSTKGNGTGLGLAHSRKILQAHGGNVELLHTTASKGSTFALILPRLEGVEVEIS